MSIDQFDPLVALADMKISLAEITRDLGGLMAQGAQLNDENLSSLDPEAVLRAVNGVQVELQRVETLAESTRAVVLGSAVQIKARLDDKGGGGGVGDALRRALFGDCGDPNCRAHGGRDTSTNKN